ncbi:hypothetical protein B0A52_09024 [Exophiala mesophila]|uniref:Uncharacterized protein n=1 Tax=Exophiala mesophila TaxID=212818 RepID=A0A438MVJ2_EXOME|nr:hypothetical protein B0A52_09024 [Exophiala mesophila]
MEFPQEWTPPSSTVSNHSSTFANSNSYFTRPHKIVKPSSRNGSPRALARRKTTTSSTISSRTRSVVDQLRSNAQQQSCTQQNSTRSRPVSWHPHSIDLANTPSPFLLDQPYPTCPQFVTSQVHGLITPVTFPVVNEPQIHELITPLDEYPGQESAYPYQSHMYDSSAWFSRPEVKPDHLDIPMYQQSNLMDSSWQFPQPMPSTVPTAPSSPEYPPAISLDKMTLGSDGPDSKSQGEELVGMGLYDSPADLHSTSLFGGFSATKRKSLKLEESFEPEVREEGEEVDAESEEEEEDEADDDDSFQIPAKTPYYSQSIASHFSLQSEPTQDSIASRYLASLGQINSPYYPSNQDHGWI